MNAKKPLNYDELYANRFIKAGHFHGKPVTLTLKEAGNEDLEGEDGKKKKVILAFVETQLQLVLCRTNGECIKAMFGKVLANWYGKRVTFFPTDTIYPLKRGEECIRVWGSPDIERDTPIALKLPKRASINHTLRRVELPAKPGGEPKA